MQIIAGVRCRNEEELLPVFLSNLGFCDHVVVADGGSTDHSKEIACRDPRVIWYDFPDRVPGLNGGWRNPEGKHMRFLLDRCEEITQGPDDWLWITEVDAFPNLRLQQEARPILEDLYINSVPLLMTWLCYVAPGRREHYPRTMQGSGYTAWHRGVATVDVGADMEGQGNLSIPQQHFYDPGKEHSRIHLSWETEALVQQKLRFYQEVHGWELGHPDATWAPREPLPPWAVWNDPRTASGLGGHEHADEYPIPEETRK